MSSDLFFSNLKRYFSRKEILISLLFALPFIFVFAVIFYEYNIPGGPGLVVPLSIVLFGFLRDKFSKKIVIMISFLPYAMVWLSTLF